MEDVPIRTRFRDEGFRACPPGSVQYARGVGLRRPWASRHPVTLCHSASLAATVIGFIPEKLMLY